MSPFIENKVYRRKSIHEKFGGQQQAGISTPANFPFIMIFSSNRGIEYGYQDGWQTTDLYTYTGQGQEGDMEFTKGNKAIRDHKIEGKKIHLFESKKDGLVKYVGHMVCTGFHSHMAPDRLGKLRKVIIFELKKIQSSSKQVDNK